MQIFKDAHCFPWNCPNSQWDFQCKPSIFNYAIKSCELRQHQKEKKQSGTLACSISTPPFKEM